MLDRDVRRAGGLHGLAGILLIVLVAVNLRPALTTVGPLLNDIRDDVGLSGTAAGALTTLPLMFLGGYGLLAPALRRPPRGEALLIASMTLLAAGCLLRVIPVAVALFGGSLLVGIAISIGNIAIPSIIKRDHPESITTVSAVYTLAVTLGASISSSAAVPARDALGGDWRTPLAVLAAPALVAGLAWLPRARRGAPDPPPAGGSPGVWRSPLAWCVTGFMGLQSLLAYVMIGWLPAILEDRGLGETESGLVLGAIFLTQAGGALSVPALERRFRDQRPVIAIIVVLTFAGFAGALWAPIGSIWPWAVVLGLGGGLSFATAISFIGLRAPDAHVAARLSGMAQGVGYVIAALGPLGVGALHDATHAWLVPGLAVLAVTALMTLPGLGAARIRTVGPGPVTTGGRAG